jgi:hypothetical protein
MGLVMPSTVVSQEVEAAAYSGILVLTNRGLRDVPGKGSRFFSGNLGSMF